MGARDKEEISKSGVQAPVWLDYMKATMESIKWCQNQIHHTRDHSYVR